MKQIYYLKKYNKIIIAYLPCRYIIFIDMNALFHYRYLFIIQVSSSTECKLKSLIL